MKITGVIVEYNPFYQGHAYHLNQARELTKCDVLIALISPQFNQRGEPNVVSKEIRTKWALDNGVDLVIELPFIFAVENPDIFAFGALSLLTDLGVDTIVLGAESGPTEVFIQKFADCEFTSPRLDDVIHELLLEGKTYRDAKNMALALIHDYHLENPSDILAHSYVKMIQKHRFPLRYIIMKRQPMFPNDGACVTAQSIRYSYSINPLETIKMFPGLNQSDWHLPEDYFTLLKFKLLTITPEQLLEIHLVDEGLQYLFINQIKEATSLTDFINKCTSKRFSGARISRTIIHILANTSKTEAATILASKPPYIRILGTNLIGRKYLASLRKTCTTPLVNRFNAKDFPLLLMELKTTALYFSNAEEPRRTQEYIKERTIFPLHYK